MSVGIARDTDLVFSLTGTGDNCDSPMMTTTGEHSSNVFVNGLGVVRKDDQVGEHPASGCGLDDSVLTTYSLTVFANGREIGRIGDQYTDDNTITSGSGNVFAG